MYDVEICPYLEQIKKYYHFSTKVTKFFINPEKFFLHFGQNLVGEYFFFPVLFFFLSAPWEWVSKWRVNFFWKKNHKNVEKKNLQNSKNSEKLNNLSCFYIPLFAYIIFFRVSGLETFLERKKPKREKNNLSNEVNEWRTYFSNIKNGIFALTIKNIITVEFELNTALPLPSQP